MLDLVSVLARIPKAIDENTRELKAIRKLLTPPTPQPLRPLEVDVAQHEDQH